MTMKPRAFSLLIVLVLVVVGVAGCATFPSDSARLQGTWTGPDTAPNRLGNCTLIVSGASLEFRGSDANEWYRGSFVLNEKAAPKQLVVTITDCSAPQLVGKAGNAIYKFDGGTLTVTGRTPGKPGFPSQFGEANAQTVAFTKAR